MSGRSYMLAARIPMPREAFEAWLDEPALAGPTIGGDPPEHWNPQPSDATPRRLLTARAANGFTLARHHDGRLEVYLYDYHEDWAATQTELLLLATAARHAETETAIMFWGGSVYPDLPLGGDEPIAVLLAGPDGARFTTRYRLSALLDHLRPVEAAFLSATDEEGNWDPAGMLDPALSPGGVALG